MDINVLISNAETIAITGHVRPDGDCVGSCLGLYNYIKTYYKDKEVNVYLDKIPEKFAFLNGTELIKHSCDKEKSYDAFFYLDCGDIDRVNTGRELYDSAKNSYCIDHHISNESGGPNVYIKPDASSTSELVYELIGKEKLTKEIAECLYLGIIQDTGVLQYSNTTASTLEAVKHLLATGVDSATIIEDTFYMKSFEQNQILGRALVESIRVLDNRCIVSVITRKQMEFYGVTPLDLDGVVNALRYTRGVSVAMLIYELNTQEYKVSLRASDDIDVSKVATYFSGGGHKKAAGFTLQGTSHDVISNVVNQIQKQM